MPMKTVCLMNKRIHMYIYAYVNLNRLIEHFSNIMQDSSELSHDHSNIADIVNEKYMDVKCNVIAHRKTSEIVDNCIKRQLSRY